MSNSFDSLNCLLSWCDLVNLTNSKGSLILRCTFGDRTVFLAWQDRTGKVPFKYDVEFTFDGWAVVIIDMNRFFDAVVAPYKWHASNRKELLTGVIKT